MRILQEFVSAGLSFALYTAVLLRVRGNLVRTSGKWTLRFVPHGERWRLAIRRDAVDNSMMQVATRMIWYPVCITSLVQSVLASSQMPPAGCVHDPAPPRHNFALLLLQRPQRLIPSHDILRLCLQPTGGSERRPAPRHTPLRPGH